MAISDAQYTAWLVDQDAVRCILVEAVASISSVETTLYLSTTAYYDTVNQRYYQPIVRGNSVKAVERMSIDLKGSATLNFGDIEIDNTDGVRDAWLDYVWANRAVNVYIGDVNWARSDFRDVFIGVSADLDSRRQDTLNIKLRDKLQRLNVPVTETTLGGSTSNKDRLIPWTFGSCYNISPLLKDPATLVYIFNGGQAEDVIEVRSNGVTASVSEDLIDGEFTPAVNPQGTKITASVQGDKNGGTYITTVADIIERLVTDFGESNRQFDSADLDSANLSAFNSANSQEVGIYLDSRTNLLNVCQDIAASVGAQMVMSRAGELQLHKVDLPPPGTPFEVTESDIIEDTLTIAERPEVQAAVTLNYCKNWTVQTELETSVVQGSKDDFEQEWLSVTVSDSAVKTSHRQLAEPEPIDTFLTIESEATAEANRRLTLWKTQRHVLSFSGRARLMEVQLGDALEITHSRYGLSGGKTGMVVGISLDWSNLTVDLEVLV